MSKKHPNTKNKKSSSKTSSVKKISSKATKTQSVVTGSTPLLSKRLKYVLLALITIVLALGLWFLWWTAHPYQANEKDYQQAVAIQDVSTTENSDYWLVSSKTDVEKTQGLLFFPGGNVEAKSYVASFAPLVEKRPEMIVVIIKPKFNLSLLDVQKVFKVRYDISRLNNFQTINIWSIGGHSLGGVAACQAAAREQQASFMTVILIGSYCNDDISVLPTPVLSIRGSKDAKTTAGAVADHQKNIDQKHSKTVTIEGMNHAQAGYYGPQDGDGRASISNHKATEGINQAIIDFLNDLN